MILRRVLPFLLVFLVLVFSGPANADCANPPGVEGENLYNADHNTMQFCDGTVWWAMKSGGGLPACAEGETIVLTGSGWGCGSGGGCAAPTLCPNVGDVCDDGNGGTTNDPIFAGFIAYETGECAALYVTDAPQSATAMWSTSPADDIAQDSLEDGSINVNQIKQSAAWIADPNNFPAIKLCDDLTDGGFTDWYMPAQEEMLLIWSHEDEIEANAAAPFGNRHWTSTEHDYYTDTAVGIRFVGETIEQGGKTNIDRNTRCVRRD